MSHAIAQFKETMRSTGLTPPDTIEPGKIYRFPGIGKGRGDDSGRCKLFDDGLGGWFMDYSTGLSDTWQAERDKPFTKAELTAFQQRCEADRIKREAEEQQRHEAAALEAAEILAAASGDTVTHPYAIKKVVSLGALVKRGAWTQRGWNDALLIPMYDPNGRIWSIEAINTDGEKDYLKNGRKRGGFYPFGKIRSAERILIGEGVATVAAVHAVDGVPAVAALDAVNMEPVARAVRELSPDAVIVLLADNDIKDDGSNPGIQAATEAARAVAGIIAIPELDGKKCDFWDLWHERGPEAVRDVLSKVAEVAAGEPAKQEQLPVKIEPEPLRAALPAAEAYPVDRLGDILGGAANALHEVVKAPLALCCQSVLAAASLAIQAHYDIKLPWGECKPLSLFLLTVGESGERKSTIDDLVLGAAKTQERADMAIYAEAQEDYEREKAAYDHAADAARKAAKNKTAAEVYEAVENCGQKPKPPVAPIRFVTDPTVEGLYKLLVTGQPSVALFSDEGGLLIGGHALNSDNALKTMARWCKFWDGAPFDRVRAGDGAGILYGRRMSMHQQAQPDVMVKLLSDRTANGQGFLARCLVAWPESTIGSRYMDAFEWAGDRHEMKRLYAVLKTLMEAQLPVEEGGQELHPTELSLSDDARVLAVAASNQFEALMAKGADLMELRDRASKALENACRIAGILAVIEGGLSVEIIESKHLERALVLVQWYLKEALRIRGASAVPQSVLDAESLSAWLQERAIKVFRSKQVLNAGPSQLRNKARFNSAIAELLQAGYIVENEPGCLVDGIKAKKSWTLLSYVV